MVRLDLNWSVVVGSGEISSGRVRLAMAWTGNQGSGVVCPGPFRRGGVRVWHDKVWTGLASCGRIKNEASVSFLMRFNKDIKESCYPAQPEEVRRGSCVS